RLDSPSSSAVLFELLAKDSDLSLIRDGPNQVRLLPPAKPEKQSAQADLRPRRRGRTSEQRRERGHAARGHPALHARAPHECVGPDAARAHRPGGLFRAPRANRLPPLDDVPPRRGGGGGGAAGPAESGAP